MQLGWGNTDKLLSFKGTVVEEKVPPAVPDAVYLCFNNLPDQALLWRRVTISYLPTAQEWKGVLQTEIREEVGAEENMIKVIAVRGVEIMSRDYVHHLFSYKNYGTSNEARRSQAKNNKMKRIFMEWVTECLDSLPKGCCDC